MSVRVPVTRLGVCITIVGLAALLVLHCEYSDGSVVRGVDTVDVPMGCLQLNENASVDDLAIGTKEALAECGEVWSVSVDDEIKGMRLGNRYGGVSGTLSMLEMICFRARIGVTIDGNGKTIRLHRMNSHAKWMLEMFPDRPAT